MPTESPFAHIPPDKMGDIRFLLERVYAALVRKIENLETIAKGEIGVQRGEIDKLKEAVGHQDACPCPKRHDPASTCPLWLLEKEVLRNKWRNAGVYSGVFLSGAVSYYIMQLLFSYLRISGHG